MSEPRPAWQTEAYIRGLADFLGGLPVDEVRAHIERLPRDWGDRAITDHLKRRYMIGVTAPR